MLLIARFVLTLVLSAALLGASGSRADPSSQAGDPQRLALQSEGPQFDVPRFDLPRFDVPLLQVTADGSGWVLSVDFDVPWTPSLEDAVVRGVPLYFVAEFELRRSRWWWWDELVVEHAMTWRLSYHALTRQYRLALHGVIQPFDTLGEALHALARVRGWRVVETAGLSPGRSYDAQVRLRLDISQLPKPFQVSGLTHRDWTPQAEWKRFTFTLPTPKNAP